MKTKKITSFAIILCLLITSLLTGCGKREESTTIRIGAMSGPTAMGLVKLMSDAEQGTTENTYQFAALATDASAMVAPIATGELDIAAVPSNLASNLYAKTEGGVQVIATCSLGVLNLLSKDASVTGLSDLSGKTIYATGQGAVPEYTIRHLLQSIGIDPDKDVSLIFCSDTTEALSYVTEMENATAILPQPFATAACSKVDGLRIVEDLNDTWNQIYPETSIVTGVLVVRKEFAEKYPEQLNKFLEEYEASVAFTSENPEEAAQLIADYGIVAAAPLAQKALPGCHITCLTGEALKSSVSAFLQILFDQNPASVGGQLPGEDFYY